MSNLFKHIISSLSSGGLQSWQVGWALEGWQQVDQGHSSLRNGKLSPVESHHKLQADRQGWNREVCILTKGTASMSKSDFFPNSLLQIVKFEI